VARAEKGASTVGSCTMHARLRAINVGHSCRKGDVDNMAMQQLQTREGRKRALPQSAFSRSVLSIRPVSRDLGLTSNNDTFLTASNLALLKFLHTWSAT
jgi:hypothetical protein